MSIVGTQKVGNFRLISVEWLHFVSMDNPAAASVLH